MGLLSNRVAEADLAPGDHIYSWRRGYLYAHHGIYVGGGRVIHFTRGRDRELGTGTRLDVMFASSAPPAAENAMCAACGLHGLSHGVVDSCLACFLSGCPLYRYAYSADVLSFLGKRGGTCSLTAAHGAEATVRRARCLLAHGFGEYQLFDNNCEDFAVYCKTELLVLPDRTRLGGSAQAASIIGAFHSAALSAPARMLTASGPAVSLALVAGFYYWGRVAHDIGVRKDAVRLPVEELVENLKLAQHSAQEAAALRVVGTAAALLATEARQVYLLDAPPACPPHSNNVDLTTELATA
eukprot:SM000001S04670  [mRNA]  locus=s1:1666607:1668012:+ [translate_table: standard]